MGIKKPVKIIKVENCQTCPYEGKCKAWTSLTKKQRFRLVTCNTTPIYFILAKCHLEDEIIDNKEGIDSNE